VITGSGTNIRAPPLITPFTHSVLPRGHYSHYALSATLHGSYFTAMHVPFDWASARHAAPSFGPSGPPLPFLRCLLCDGLCLHEFLGPPLRSCSHQPARNHEMRRFIRDSLYAEVEAEPSVLGASAEILCQGSLQFVAFSLCHGGACG
jgi:hypothetical protein